MRTGRSLLSLCLALPGLLGCGGAPTQPNVVIVSVDTLRYDVLAPYGGPVPTPHFAALAESGVLFEEVVAPSAETAPSHATLLTGQGVLRHGVTENGALLSEAPPTLANAFREAGYATAGFVSSFVLDPRFGWARGFDVYDAEFPKDGSSFHPERLSAEGFWKGAPLEGFDRSGRETNRRALAWLESTEEPFFLFLHWFDPHSPYSAPRRYLQAASRAPVDLSERRVAGFSSSDLAQLVRLYRAEVMLVDDLLGELLRALDERGVRRRTLLVVTADHGEGFGEHGWLSHQVHLYEEQVRVPLFLSWPGVLPVKRLPGPVGLVDLAPTVLTLAGLSPGGELEGHALRFSEDPARQDGDPVLFGYRRRYVTPYHGHEGEKFSVRSGPWKYIRASAEEDELYDLEADPLERSNLRAVHPEVVARLGALLDARLERHPPGEAPTLDLETRRGLEVLGYLPETSSEAR